MSDKDKRDLTRIEDLSDFLHSEDDDDLSDIEAALSIDDSPPDLPTSNNEFGDMATDPDINIPDDFNNSDAENTDFTALEDQEEDFEKDNHENESFSSYANDEFVNDVQTQFDSEDDFSSDDDEFPSAEENQFDSENNFSSEEDEFSSAEENPFDSENNFSEEGSVNFETENDFDNDNESDFNFKSDFEDEEQEQEPNTAENNEFDSDEQSPTDDFNEEFEGEEVKFSDDDTEFADNENFGIEQDISFTQVEDQIPELPDEQTSASLPESSQETEQPIESFSDDNKTPIAQMEDSPAYKSPENFKELQQFARNMSYGNMAKEGNPPFSIILKDIKFEEDVDDIVRFLIEFKVIETEDRESSEKSLRRGSLLIPRLSEFAAISLCHKLRRYDINILMGLTEEVSPAKNYESDDRGLATKHNVYNNKQHSWLFEKQDIGLIDVLVATTPYIEGHDILEYISIVTESTIIDMGDFINPTTLEEQIQIEIEQKSMQKDDFYPNVKENSGERINLGDIYKSLVEKCKAHTLSHKGNALIGINFQIIPVLIDDPIHVHSRYQITCSGSVVWIKKR